MFVEAYLFIKINKWIKVALDGARWRWNDTLRHAVAVYGR